MGLGIKIGVGIGDGRGGGADPSVGYALYLPFSAASPTYRSGATSGAISTLPGYSYSRSGAKQVSPGRSASRSSRRTETSTWAVPSESSCRLRRGSGSGTEGNRVS